jgi:predicted ATPase/DNA-binding SARP family transcriptional activator
VTTSRRGIASERLRGGDTHRPSHPRAAAGVTSRAVMEFGILGPLEVRADGRTVALGGARPRAVFAVLALHANQPVTAERLAVALWGEDAPSSAVKTVQVYVARLRKALDDPDALVTTPAGYRLRVRPDELDAERFERQVADGREALAAGHAEHAAAQLREALGLWRGAPLADLAATPFAPAEIARLEEQHLAAVEVRVDADLAVGRHAELVGELQQLTTQHPWRERLHAQLMLALYRSGRQADALEAYRHARDVLVEQLGIEPGAELHDLQQAILAHDPEIAAPAARAIPPSDGRSALLPAPPTTLFGREDDLAALADLIRELRTRLVTLVGPGGVGKTRLAIEAARQLAQDFPDGARFVALASVSEPRDLASAIVRALAAPTRPGEPAETALVRFLNDRHLLLVVDNFEHLIAGAPLLAELLDACTRLTILLTSREPTRLAAERLHPVRPLALPDAARSAQTGELERYAAVAMFCDRARARNPEFAVDEVNAPYVAEICHRLDGLPLALELAAARVGLLSPAELAARLERGLTVLSRGAPDAPDRHRTLRAAIDWSVHLLTGPERATFTHMAAFPSGATVEVAESLTGGSLDTLDSLVAKQLLVRRDDRLVMLETVREYARERLAEDPTSGAVQHRLATWCVSFAREATPHLVTADRVRWLARLDAELPNLLAALDWALEDRRAELALQLVNELGTYWWLTAQWESGLPWIEAALDQTSGASTQTRANTLLCRARLIGIRQTQRYVADVEAALELFRACDDASGIAASLAHLADAEAWLGHPEHSGVLLDEAREFAERADDEAALAVVLTARSLAATGYEDSARRSRAAIEHLRRLDNVVEVAHLCNCTGFMAVEERRYEEALAWLSEGLDAARPLGYPKLVFLIRGNEGLARLFLDESDQAEQAFCDALAVCHAGGCDDIVDETLLGVAAVAARHGDLTRAARLAGAAKGHQTASRGRGEDAIWARLNEILRAPRERYGPESWDRAEREGASLSANEAIDLGLARRQLRRMSPETSSPSAT